MARYVSSSFITGEFSSHVSRASYIAPPLCLSLSSILGIIAGTHRSPYVGTHRKLSLRRSAPQPLDPYHRISPHPLVERHVPPR